MPLRFAEWPRANQVAAQSISGNNFLAAVARADHPPSATLHERSHHIPAAKIARMSGHEISANTSVNPSGLDQKLAGMIKLADDCSQLRKVSDSPFENAVTIFINRRNCRSDASGRTVRDVGLSFEGNRCGTGSTGNERESGGSAVC